METKITTKEFMDAIEVVRKYKKQLQDELNEVNEHIMKNSIFQNLTKETSIFEVNMSNHLKNRLDIYFKQKRIAINEKTTLQIFSKVSEKNIMLTRCFGEARLTELKNICLCAGVKMLP